MNKALIALFLVATLSKPLFVPNNSEGCTVVATETEELSFIKAFTETSSHLADEPKPTVRELAPNLL